MDVAEVNRKSGFLTRERAVPRFNIALRRITPEMSKNFIRHCGYVQVIIKVSSSIWN